MSGKKEPISVGYRFGLLTVCKETDERKNGYKVWVCRCDCGNEITMDSRWIKRGSKLDCGCSEKRASFVTDLRGQSFGKLTAVSPTSEHTKEGLVFWKCICECGKTVYADAGQLLKGARKSCGCLSHPPLKAFVGLHFGRLTVIGYGGKRLGSHRWECRCECGNEIAVDQALLQSGKVQSCGCLAEQAPAKESAPIDEAFPVKPSDADRSREPRGDADSGDVFKNMRNGKWCAQITVRGTTYFLGCFENKRDAILARKQGELQHKEYRL